MTIPTSSEYLTDGFLMILSELFMLSDDFPNDESPYRVCKGRALLNAPGAVRMIELEFYNLRGRSHLDFSSQM